MDGMTVTIDKAGRIVVPKAIRDRLGLVAGTELACEENGGGLTLRLRNGRAAMHEENGLLVHDGQLPPGYDWDRLVDEDRERRIRAVLGDEDPA